jgi:hypothetical protein
MAVCTLALAPTNPDVITMPERAKLISLVPSVSQEQGIFKTTRWRGKLDAPCHNGQQTQIFLLVNKLVVSSI